MEDIYGENAFVAPTDDDGYNPYFKRNGIWYEVQKYNGLYETDWFDVVIYIKNYGFRVVYPGLPVEVQEPQGYGARVEVDSPVQDEERVIAYRLPGVSVSPWVILFDKYTWDGFPWARLSELNPKILSD